MTDIRESFASNTLVVVTDDLQYYLEHADKIFQSKLTDNPEQFDRLGFVSMVRYETINDYEFRWDILCFNLNSDALKMKFYENQATKTNYFLLLLKNFDFIKSQKNITWLLSTISSSGTENSLKPNVIFPFPHRLEKALLNKFILAEQEIKSSRQLNIITMTYQGEVDPLKVGMQIFIKLRNVVVMKKQMKWTVNRHYIQ